MLNTRRQQLSALQEQDTGMQMVQSGTCGRTMLQDK